MRGSVAPLADRTWSRHAVITTPAMTSADVAAHTSLRRLGNVEYIGCHRCTVRGGGDFDPSAANSVATVSARVGRLSGCFASSSDTRASNSGQISGRSAGGRTGLEPTIGGPT